MTNKFYRLSIFALVLMLSTLSVTSAQDDEPTIEPITLPNSAVLHMDSAQFEEDFVIWVALPDAYATTDNAYPVLYVLDPQVTFGTVVDVSRLGAFVGALPETIVVGIGYQPDDVVNGIGELRIRDFITEPENFLGFVQDDVIPMIESNYRVDPNDKGLMGWSAGASFVLYTMFSEPTLFQRYISLSPILQEVDGNSIRQLEQEFFDSETALNANLFLAVGGLERNALAIFDDFVDTLDGRNYPNLYMVSAIIEDVSHTSVIAGAIAVALPRAYCRLRQECTEAQPVG